MCVQNPRCVPVGVLPQTRHDPTSHTPTGGPFLWSNSPETFAGGDNTRSVLARLTITEATTLRVGCHHANKSGQNRRLCVVVVNTSTTEQLTVTVPRNVQHHQYIQVGSGLGYTVAIPGREVSTAWFAGTNIAGHEVNLPNLEPGGSVWLELGDDVGQGVRRVRSHVDQQEALWFGVLSALLELSVGGPAVVYVAATEQDVAPSYLDDLSNAAARDLHKRGSAEGYGALTTYESIVARVPRVPTQDDRYYHFCQAG